jgi:hypothetical protein
MYICSQILHSLFETRAHNCTSNTSRIFLLPALHRAHSLAHATFAARISESCFGEKSVSGGEAVSKCKRPHHQAHPYSRCMWTVPTHHILVNSPDYHAPESLSPFLLTSQLRSHQRFFCSVVVRNSANGGWSLQILTNLTLPSHQAVAIRRAKYPIS